MEYVNATEKELEQIFHLVQDTITTIYPKYYPSEVVDAFCELHSKENIYNDIKSGRVGVLLHDDLIVGTGSYSGQHITRVYVAPQFQGQGFGSYIMECLEKEIASNYVSAYLDASLPACSMYEHRGYKTLKHERWEVKNGVVLIYEIMEKQLYFTDTDICYEGKVFIPRCNTENGEVDGETVFYYHQQGNILWADYSGGEITRGSLVGTVSQGGELDFHYQHINKMNQIRIGKCHSVPKILENGKIELSEEWQWLNGDKSAGSSIVVER